MMINVRPLILLFFLLVSGKYAIADVKCPAVMHPQGETILFLPWKDTDGFSIEGGVKYEYHQRLVRNVKEINGVTYLHFDTKGNVRFFDGMLNHLYIVNLETKKKIKISIAKKIPKNALLIPSFGPVRLRPDGGFFLIAYSKFLEKVKSLKSSVDMAEKPYHIYSFDSMGHLLGEVDIDSQLIKLGVNNTTSSQDEFGFGYDTENYCLKLYYYGRNRQSRANFSKLSIDEKLCPRNPEIQSAFFPALDLISSDRALEVEGKEIGWQNAEEGCCIDNIYQLKSGKALALQGSPTWSNSRGAIFQLRDSKGQCEGKIQSRWPEDYVKEIHSSDYYVTESGEIYQAFSDTEGVSIIKYSDFVQK